MNGTAFARPKHAQAAPVTAQSTMIQLLYISSARRAFDKPALMSLLDASRKNNEALGITGLLLYKDGSFLQVLEGEPHAVQTLYNRIERDPRHAHLMVMIDEPVTGRTFPDWSLGFRDLNDPTLRTKAGFSEVMNDARFNPFARDCPTGCLELIDLFRRGR